MKDFKDLFVEGMTLEQFAEVAEKIAQSSGDSVRTEYSQKMKELQSQIPETKTQAEIDLDERLKAIEAKEKQYELKDALSEMGLPSELSQYLRGAEGLEQFKETLNKHVLDGSYTPSKHKSTETTITKEQFKSFDYKQREQLYTDNPELYKALQD